MFEDESDDQVACRVRPRRWRWTAALSATINAAGNVGRAVTAWCDDISMLLAQHTAIGYDHDDMVASVRQDLESLPMDE